MQFYLFYKPYLIIQNNDNWGEMQNKNYDCVTINKLKI